MHGGSRLCARRLCSQPFRCRCAEVRRAAERCMSRAAVRNRTLDLPGVLLPGVLLSPCCFHAQGVHATMLRTGVLRRPCCPGDGFCATMLLLLVARAFCRSVHLHPRMEFSGCPSDREM